MVGTHTQVTRVYALWEHSGPRLTCQSDPSVGTRWNLGELNESVIMPVSIFFLFIWP